jgi:hypothetical protein
MHVSASPTTSALTLFVASPGRRDALDYLVVIVLTMVTDGAPGVRAFFGHPHEKGALAAQQLTGR